MGKIRKRPSPPEFVIREVSDVPLSYLDDTGAVIKENFTIQFKSFTESGSVKLFEKLSAEILPNGVLPYSALFAHSVIAILDSNGEALTNDTGEQAVLTREFFAGMLPEDLEAINAAIEADANPPKPPATPSVTLGDSGTNPGAVAA